MVSTVSERQWYGNMSHEVRIGKTLFIVNSFPSETAKETVEQMLRRVIVQNAEREFKNSLINRRCEKGIIRKLP